MQDESLLGANLAALRRRSPEYADVLSSVPAGSGYSFAQVGSALSCRDASGTWIHGPEDPWEQARRDAAPHVGAEPSLHIVLRPGLGYLPLRMLEAGACRRGSILLIVEDRVDLVKAALSRVDWSPIFGSTSTAVLFGDPRVTVKAFLERHPALSVLPMNLIVPPELEGTELIEGLGRELVSLSEKAQMAIETDLSIAGNHLRERRGRKDPLRVLLTVPEIGYLADPIADGFRACGAGVALEPQSPNGSRGIRAHDWVQQISRFAPDVVLWMNRPELSHAASSALRQLRIANVHWSVDSPRRMQIEPWELDLVDVHLCFDAAYLSAPRGAQSQLSLGAGLEPLPGCRPSDERWPARSGPDITFVGTLGEARVREIREQLLRTAPEKLALLDEVARGEGDPAAAFEAATQSAYRGAQCMYVDEVRTTRWRKEVLSALPAATLRIFGGHEWLSAGGSLAASYAGRAVPYGFDLASLYYHSKINLNIFHEQCIDSTNSRVYDVLAAGGFLLTEHKPRIAAEFEIGRHLVTFSTPEEAREKAAYFLGHPQEREAIAREGQKHVLERHSFRERCRRILGLAGAAVDLRS